VAGKKRKWLTNVGAFTLAGAATSASVGGALAAVGSAALPVPGWRPAVVVAIVLWLAGAGRELGLVRVPLPQPFRQTRGAWAKRFSGVVTSTLWGADIGFVFTTRFTSFGVWPLAASAVIWARPLAGAVLFLGYWSGRALSVWVSPVFVRDATGALALVSQVRGQYTCMRRVHAIALTCGAVVLMETLFAN